MYEKTNKVTDKQKGIIFRKADSGKDLLQEVEKNFRK
jgi:hypothetical protein